MSDFTQPQIMIEQEWRELGERLFDANTDQWRFRCPHCAYGLFSGPFFVTRDEKRTPVFGFDTGAPI